ncbi:MAG: hypothetical protein U1E60_09120 [Reyranellaceae bacterium]
MRAAPPDWHGGTRRTSYGAVPRGFVRSALAIFAVNTLFDLVP